MTMGELSVGDKFLLEENDEVYTKINDDGWFLFMVNSIDCTGRKVHINPRDEVFPTT